MTIWIYRDICRQPEELWLGHTCCRFCRQKYLEILHSTQSSKTNTRKSDHLNKRLFVCQTCGWWKADGLHSLDFLYRGEPTHNAQTHYGAAASLSELSLDDISVPLDDVRSYLLAKYEKRFEMAPKLFEETVASVFRDIGYEAVVVGRSGDGGIDIILERGQETIGVQIKRYSDAIEVEQIRSLVGALVLKGMTCGVFVTTSKFRRGAKLAEKAYATQGYKIKLIDAERFYDALKIAKRPKYSSFADFPIPNIFDRLQRLDRVPALPFRG
jgi:restriction system protein